MSDQGAKKVRDHIWKAYQAYYGRLTYIFVLTNRNVEMMPGYGWRWRHGRGPGRPMKPRVIKGLPEVSRFIPASPKGNIISGKEPLVMTPDELEALRLVDYDGLLQEEAAQRMGVSRGTVWRCLDSARRKVATMLVEGRELVITSSEEHLTQNITSPPQKDVKG